jgi:hypothetical protein
VPRCPGDGLDPEVPAGPLPHLGLTLFPLEGQEQVDGPGPGEPGDVGAVGVAETSIEVAHRAEVHEQIERAVGAWDRVGRAMTGSCAREHHTKDHESRGLGKRP